MPLDPSISLQGAGAASQPTNPLALVEGVATLQNRLNQNTMFQQGMAAKQLMGTMASESVDPDTGQLNYDSFLTKMYSHPLTAAFAPEAAAQIRAGQLSQFQLIGQQQEQAQKFMKGFHDTLASTGGNQEMLEPALNAFFASQPDYLKQKFGSAVQDYGNHLLAPPLGMDKVPPDVFKQRLLTSAAIAGFDPARMSTAFGQTGIQNTGSTLQPTKQNLATGAITKSSGALPLSMTPSEGAEPVSVLNPQTQQMESIPKSTFAARGGQPIAPPLINGMTPSEANSLVQGPVDPVSGGPTQITKAQASKVYGTPDGSVPAGVKTALGPGEQKEFDNMADYEKDLNNFVENLKPVSVAMEVERKAASAFQMNGWAQARGEIAKQLQGLQATGAPVSQSLIDRVANGDISSYQTFKAAMTPVIMGQFKQGVEGTGRGMMVEVKQYLDKYPGVTNDPAMYENISNMIAKTARWAQGAQQGLVSYKQRLRAGDPSLHGYMYPDFPAWYNNQLSANHEFQFPDIHNTAKGASEENAARQGGDIHNLLFGPK